MNDEVAQEVENEEIAGLPEEVPAEKPESLRETIEKARDDINAKETEEPKEKEVKAKSVKSKPSEKPRSVDGKFLPKEDPEKSILEQKTEIIPPPQAYSGAVKAKWGELPKEIQQELSKREQDFHRELTKHDEDRNFGKQMKDVVTPYVAQIRAEGAEPHQAVANLLNMAHVLRVGSPQQKSDLLLRTAQAFGVDLKQAFQVQQTQPQLHPQVQNALQEVQNIKQQIESEKALKKQQEDTEIQGQIKEFAADPKNIHFETLKAHMAALLQGGMAKNLQDAYDQALYANPHTRSSLLEAQKAEQSEKRVAEQKARAEAARKAGSSIKGAPGIMATKDAKINGLDLRSTIKAAMAKSMDS